MKIDIDGTALILFCSVACGIVITMQEEQEKLFFFGIKFTFIIFV